MNREQTVFTAQPVHRRGLSLETQTAPSRAAWGTGAGCGLLSCSGPAGRLQRLGTSSFPERCRKDPTSWWLLH